MQLFFFNVQKKFLVLLNSSPNEYSNSPALSRVTFAAHPINRNAGINNKMACRMEESQRYM